MSLRKSFFLISMKNTVSESTPHGVDFFCRCAAGRRAAVPHRTAPHILFRLGEKERAAPGTRKSRLVQTCTKCLSIAVCTSVSLYPARQALTHHPRRAFRFAARSCGAGGGAIHLPRWGIQRGGPQRSRLRFSALRMRRAPCGWARFSF